MSVLAIEGHFVEAQYFPFLLVQPGLLSWGRIVVAMDPLYAVAAAIVAVAGAALV